MATKTIVLCDQCGEDITEGRGRYWRLNVMSEKIPIRQGTIPRWNAHAILPMKHFCGPVCLSNWALAAADVDAAEEARADAAARASATDGLQKSV